MPTGYGLCAHICAGWRAADCGADPGRRNLTNPLIRAPDGGGGLPRLDTSRLRATWLADCAELPIGVRARQLLVRTLLVGMLLALADHRPAHLSRVHQTLITLPGDDQARLGIVTDWKHGPHLLTYRQTERTFGLMADALAKDAPDGLPSDTLTGICDGLLEASIPEKFKNASRSLAVDWTDMESFSRPPPARGGECAGPEASWGHRKNNLLRSQDELFFGYYLSAGVMMPDENSPAVPELARCATLSSCRHDPVRALAPVLTAMPAAGIPLGDVLADSGWSLSTAILSRIGAPPSRPLAGLREWSPDPRGRLDDMGCIWLGSRFRRSRS